MPVLRVQGHPEAIMATTNAFNGGNAQRPSSLSNGAIFYRRETKLVEEAGRQEK